MKHLLENRTAGRPARLSQGRRWCLVGALVLGLSLCQNVRAYTFSTLSAFSSFGGNAPSAGLILGSNGLFYGTTTRGGAWGNGTVFVLTPPGGLTNLASFDGTNGAQCQSPLLQGLDGNFYGTTFAGGAYGLGAAFMMTPAGALSFLASFDGTNGARPMGRLCQASDGTLYGTASEGGAYSKGTVFKIGLQQPLKLAPQLTITPLVSLDGTNGSRPAGALVLVGSTNGTLYGTAAGGGVFNAGTVFSLSVSGNGLTAVHAFTGGGDGAGPQSGLVSTGGSSLYGTSAAGGTNGGFGTVFRVSTGGSSGNSFTTLFSFDQTNAATPLAPLIKGGDGNLYGTTISGGTSGKGTVYEISGGNNLLTVLRSFSGGADGANPFYAGVVQGTNGNLYGTAYAGGQYQSGTVFEISGFAPTILSGPASQAIMTGSTVTLAVNAVGSLPLTYQWQRNSNNLPNQGGFSGVTTPTLTISNAVPANSGVYWVIVRNSAGSVTNAAITLSVDRPTIRITSPAPGARLTTGHFTLTGSAGGAQAVTQVYYRLNGGAWQLANPGANWTRWQANVTLVQGSNWVQSYGVNLLGFPSVTNPPVGFFCGLDGVPVRVQINGNGTVAPNYDLVYLPVGKSCRMTATPASDCLFSNWTGTVSTNPVWISNAPTVTFNVASNLVIQANFVPNPFLGLSGTYNGLFFNTNTVAQSSSGAFTFSLATKGAFSGSVLGDGGRYSMSGQFDLTGVANCTIKRAKLEPLSARFALDLAGGSQRVAGVISNSLWSAELAGDRAAYDGKTRIAPQAGAYTLVLPGNPGLAAEPAGDSWGTATVDKAGRVSLSGSLADGTRISQSMPISTNGQWPLYVPLYGNQGSLISWVTLNASTGPVIGAAGWIKPAGAKALYYTNGFARLTNLLGSSYQAPGGKTNVLAFTNGTLALSEGNLPAGLTNVVELLARNVVSNVSGSKLSLSFKPANGSFSGSVVNPSTRKAIPFTGVVLQNADVGRGFFLGTNLSGLVLLSAQPQK